MTKGIESLEAGDRTAAGIGHRLAVVALSLACAAFTWSATVNVLRWRTTETAQARDVLGNRGASVRQRNDAGVILYNDTAKTIEAYEAADDPGVESIVNLDNIARRASQAADRMRARRRK